jgi:RNA polymerase sigma-70 factor (sigma-E family)
VIDGSFEEFVHGSIGSLVRQAYALTGDRYAAEDLVQETLVRVAGAWRRLREDGNPAGYATTAMYRTYISWWRTRRRRPTVELTIDPQSTTDDYATVDSRLLLRQALGTLPRLQHAVLVATYLHDFSDDQIAVLINRAPSTVRSIRHRGLKSLSATLGSGDEPERRDAALADGRRLNDGESGVTAS